MIRYAIVPIIDEFNGWSPSSMVLWLGLFSSVRWKDGKPDPKSCFPSRTGLEEWTGYTSKTVRSALAYLKSSGLAAWSYDKRDKRTYYTFPVLAGHICPLREY